jgi:hypothetical protein
MRTSSDAASVLPCQRVSMLTERRGSTRGSSVRMTARQRLNKFFFAWVPAEIFHRKHINRLREYSHYLGIHFEWTKHSEHAGMKRSERTGAKP